ncbi:chaplin [Streptomyces sp. NPDC087300]|uniref:chaplin n=1 Tax=Streptomyces sp. NPDC087300 TaxID=3365780 RepID=UPI003820DB2E
MRQALSKGMLSAAAATSILSLSGTGAYAATASGGQDMDAGLLSGNRVAAPLDVPLALCGNTADGAAALNPASGNTCATETHTTETGTAETGTATASGETAHSPGLLSGNNVQVPITAPVNVCGDAVDVVALASGTTGNRCGSGASHEQHERSHVPDKPVDRTSPPAPVEAAPERAVPSTRTGELPEPLAPHASTASSPTAPKTTVAEPGRTQGEQHAPKPVGDVAPRAQLAETGADGSALGAGAAAAGLVLGGAILYRRGRTAASV